MGAQAVLPELNKAQSQFDQLSGLLAQLPPETRKLIAETIASIRPNIDQLIDRVLALPGVSTVLKPAVGAIRSKLDALAATI